MRVVLLSLLLSVMASRARAEEPVPEAYTRAIAEALAEYEAGNFSEARVLFEEAHGIYENARTLRGLGITAIELRLYVEAEVSLRAALESTVRPLSDEQRKEAELLIARARRNIATVPISLSPATAALQVDGRSVQLDASGELRLNPGDYTFVVSAPGYVAQTRLVHAVGGQTRAMMVSLEREALGTAIEPKPATAADAASPDEAGAPGGGVWIWVAGGAGVLFAGVAIATHLVALSEADAIESACPVEPERRCSIEEIDRRIDDAGIDTLNALTITGLGLSAAAFATAGILFALDAGEGASPDPVALRVTPLGAELTGSF